MHAITIALLFLLHPHFALAHEEHTSEWYYVDERWPKHIGPLIDEKDPDAYIHQVVTKESARLSGWAGHQGTRALDTTTACGLHFDGYLRQRPRGNYVVLVISSADKQDHRLKWIPVEYRFDDEKPRYFSRREGAANQEEKHRSTNDEVRQQEDLETRSGRPDIREDEVLRAPLKYLFDNGSPQRELRTRGATEINAKYKYIEIVKFPDPQELPRHEWIQIYLPWVDNCPDKPVLVFERDKRNEVVWDYPLRAWLSAGVGFMTPYHEAGWAQLHPQPSYFLRFAYLWWNHHGFTAEGHLTTLHGASAGGDTSGIMERLSYGYSIRLSRYLWLSPEFGFRGVSGASSLSPGLGGGLNLAWEVPGTRHQTTGQRIVFEAGCNFEKHFSGIVNFHDLKGAFADCKFGFGLGW